MNRGLIILIIAPMLGIGMFFAAQNMLKPCNCGASSTLPVEDGSLLPELQWLKTTLHLTDEQFAKVQALHLAYQPKCAELCMRVHLSDKALMDCTSESHEVTPDILKLMQERAELALECRKAMLQHVYATAACMQQAQAERYLKIMLPHVLGATSSTTPQAHASH